MKYPLLALLLLAGCLNPNEPGNLVPPTVDDDETLPRIEVNGTVLHSEAFGNPENPMVMVLHGGPGADYASLLPLRALADDGYYVVFWDQRGAGLSRRHDPALYSDLPLYLEDLRQVVEHYSPDPEKPFVFIGHSWGAMYATWFIDEHSDYGGRLKGVILSEPGGFTWPQLESYLQRFFGSVSFFGEGLGDLVWGAQFMSPTEHARADYLAAAQVPEEFVNLDDPAPSWRTGAAVNGALLELAEEEQIDWTTNLSAFTPQVLFLRSALNETMPLWHQEELASSYPNAEIITMKGTGHEMMWEAPERYLEHTRTYFAEIGFEGGTP